MTRYLKSCTGRRIHCVGPCFATPGPYFPDYRYGKQRMWGALGFGVASLVGGFVYDAGSGGYGGVMVVFVTVTVVAFIAATGVPIGTNVEEAGCQESRGQRYAF